MKFCRAIFTISSFLAVLIAGCGGGGDDGYDGPRGDDGEPCYVDGTCNEGLECSQDVCRPVDGDLEPDGDTDGDADGDIDGDADGDPDGDDDLDPEGDGDIDPDPDFEPDGDGDAEPDEEPADGDDEPDADSEEEPDTDGDAEEDADGTLDPSDLILTPAPLAFDDRRVLDEDEKDFTIRNDAPAGSETVTVLSISMLETASDAFDLDLEGCEPPFDLAAGGGERTCTALFAPAAHGPHEGTLRVVGREGGGTPVEARMDLTGIARAESLHADPGTVEFGFVAPGDQARKWFTLGNLGDLPLSVGEIALAADSDAAFDLIRDRSLPLEMEPNDGFAFELTFAPTASGQAMAWVEITLEGRDTPERLIPVTGRGQADCSGGQTLSNDSCVDVCVPRAAQCDLEDIPEICDEDGLGWDDGSPCSEGMECFRGACVWTVCTAGTQGCLDGASALCADAGGEFDHSEDCADDDLCTYDVCVIGHACDHSETVFCDDGDPCTDDFCNNGTCAVSFNIDPCEDDNACTTNTHCSFGSCVGEILDCKTGNPCRSEWCDETLGCQWEAFAGDCSTGSLCTINERCEAGDCIGDFIVCNDDNDCTLDDCDPLTGCVYENSTESCNDGNACTTDDSCRPGYCAGIPVSVDDGQYCNGPEICRPDSGIQSNNPVLCNDGLTCTDDGCNEDLDACEFLPVHARCDDGNPCTVNDECVPGMGCVFTDANNGTTCDLLIGVDEVCLDGQCVTACRTDSDCRDAVDCTYDTCDLSLRLCRHEPIHDLCDNNRFCDGEEFCDYRLGCVPGEAPAVADAFACTLDSCDEETDTVVHQPRNVYCEDDNACTTDICRLGEGCVNVPHDGLCDDENPCTVGDYCAFGNCQPGLSFYDCDDEDECTDDICIPKEGCTHVLNNAPCDDGDPCTDTSFCENGACLGESGCDDGVFCNGLEFCGENGCESGPLPDCDDDVECTADYCDNVSDECAHVLRNEFCPIYDDCTLSSVCTDTGCEFEYAPEGTVCAEMPGDDYQCHNNRCVAPCQEPEDCPADHFCLVRSCDPENGFCVYTPNDAFCDNNVYCDGEEICHPFNGCESGPAVECDDGVDCTIDRCNEDQRDCEFDFGPEADLACADGNVCTADDCTPGGCNYNAVPGPCSDNDLCTTDETCTGGACIGQLLSCDDRNPCTVDFCGPEGCGHNPVPDGTSCGSGGAERVCRSGKCSDGCVTDASCNDGVACTYDYCNIETHLCESYADDAFCDDGFFCNGEETCHAEQGCLPGETVQCATDLECGEAYCDEVGQRCLTVFVDELCNDGNPCTNNVCTANGCETSYNSRACDDNNVCTENDLCILGTCTGEPTDFDDGNACTEDSCHPLLGPVHTNVSAACAIEDNPCLTGYCDPAVGCRTVFNKGPCDDGDPCTQNDICKEGSCRPGQPLACEDHDPCTNDSCDPENGCVHELTPEGGACESPFRSNTVCHYNRCVASCETDADCVDGAGCSTETCNQALGVCEYTLNHAACSDGLFCNGSERCEPFAGCVPARNPNPCTDAFDCTLDTCNEDIDQCVHTARDGLCDDGNACTRNRCSVDFGCYSQNLTGTACDDGNRCTSGDTCSVGTCTGQTITCDDGNDCTGPDGCHPDFGCVNPPVNEGETCGADGVCLSGLCALPCRDDLDCSDGINCTEDVCDPAKGRCRHFVDNALCQDGSFCNGQESCHPTFGCQAGRPVNCNDGISCTKDFCDENQKRCGHETRDALCKDGNACTVESCDALSGCLYDTSGPLSCDDGNACTEGDFCQDGACRAGSEPDCQDPDADCYSLVCESRLGCVKIPKSEAEGQLCEDNNACTLSFDYSSYCIGTECTSFVNCTDGNPCTVDTCVPETGCEFNDFLPDGTACAIPGAGTGECSGGQCQAVCAGNEDCDDEEECTTDQCDGANGCLHDPVPDGTECAGGSGACWGGLCIVVECTGPEDCDDDNPCTADSCHPQRGCQHEDLNGDACEDGNLCTIEERCVAGACIPGGSAACNDGDFCTADDCDPGLGCLHPVANEGLSCQDGDPCTENDVCTGGVCLGEVVDCDDDNPCTEDACMPGSGCENRPQNGIACDDGNACTTQSLCVDGLCIGTAMLDCDDGDPCTYTICEVETGCRTENLSGVACSDGNPCTTGDVCENGICQPGTGTLDCDDGDPCTVDSCQAGACIHPPAGFQAPCDVNPHLPEVCINNQCVEYCFGAGECDDDVACTVDTCNAQHHCVFTPVNANCNDGNACTENVCSPTDGCLFDTPVVCDDGVDCTDDTCKAATGCVFTPQDYLCDDLDDCTLDICNPETEGGCEHPPAPWCE